MAVEKTIVLKVVDGEVKIATSDLKKLGLEVDKVESKSKKAGSSLESSFDGANTSIDNLGSGVKGVGTEFVRLGKAAKNGGKAMRSALISTGIGALVVALGLVVDYWDDIVDAINRTNVLLERQQTLIKENIQTLNNELKILDSQLELAKLRGESTDALINKRKDLLDSLILEQQILVANATQRKIQLQEEQSRLGFFEKVLDLQLKVFGQEGLKGKGILSNEERKELSDLDTEITDAAVAINQLIAAREALNGGAGGGATTTGARDKVSGVSEVEGERLGVFGEDPLRAVLEQELEITNIKAEALAERAKNDEAYAKFLEREKQEEKKREEALAKYKIDTAVNVLGALSMIAEEGSAGAKAIAVAQAILSTYQGINKALAETTDFTPSQTLRFANAAAVGIAGFANVAKILSTDSSGKASSIGAGGGGGGGIKAPSFNVVGTSGVNQLAESLQSQDQPIRAYLTSGDINTGAELERNRIETATLS